MFEPKKRTFGKSPNAAPGVWLKIQDPARINDGWTQGERPAPTHSDTVEIREDLLNRLIEAIKAI